MSTVINLTNGKFNAKINSMGAQLLSFNDGETEYMWQADEKVWGFTAPVLFPICGGMNDGGIVYNGKKYEMPQHGFARFKEFEVEKCTETRACFLLKSDEDTKQQYPFDFEFRVVFEIVENKLNITYSVINMTEGKMYFSFGGHEGYATPEGVEEYEIKFENDTTLTRLMLKNGFFDGNTEEIVLENNKMELKYSEFEKCTYIFRNINSESVVLEHKSGKRKVRIGFPGHETLAIWTLPVRNYVCIEPWCGISENESFNGDITQKDGIVELGQSETFERTHYIEAL